MSFKSRIINRIKKNPHVIPFWLCKYTGLSSLSDYINIKTRWGKNRGYSLNLKRPRKFSEKLEWMKLYDRNPLYTKWVDKVTGKNLAARIIGDDHIIKTLKVWDRAEDIDISELPEKFVMKCTHDSGSVLICTDKSKFDVEKAKDWFRHFLARDFYKLFLEWPYKNVPHRIIVEEYIETGGEELIDYKFYCFNGYVDCVMVCIERSTGHPKFYFFDRKWNLLKLNPRGVNAPADFTLPKPEGIDEMFDMAEKLSKGLRFARVDLYCNQGKIYFGEMTFFPSGGYDRNRLDSTEERWGNLIKLD